MDMEMPELDGPGATALLRRMGWEGPIVALTGYVQEDDRRRCLEAGCDDYLSKPISAQDLLEMVFRYVGPRQSTGA